MQGSLDLSADGLQKDAAPAAELAQDLVLIFGDTARAILHYGSYAQGRTTGPESAFDFFIVVSDYSAAYRAAAGAIGPAARPRLATFLARLLPPNALRIRKQHSSADREAKCIIITERHFKRECSSRARDHFVQARMIQRVILIWARDEGSAEAVRGCVQEARERSFSWARAFLPLRFDLTDYCRTLLRVSFTHEIRAEPKGHDRVLYEAQRSFLYQIYGPLLERLAAQGMLEQDGDNYRQPVPVSAPTRLRVKAYFHRSRIRTTMRLLKHPFLYDDWQDYLVRKVARSTGRTIELTDRERRRPLLFLWPRVVRYLRARPEERPGR